MNATNKKTNIEDDNYETAKADIAKNCALYPGYEESIGRFQSMLAYLGGRNASSAFDTDFSHTPPKDGED